MSTLQLLARARDIIHAHPEAHLRAPTLTQELGLHGALIHLAACADCRRLARALISEADAWLRG